MPEMRVNVNGQMVTMSRTTGEAYNRAIAAQATARETQQRAARQQSSSRGAETTATNTINNILNRRRRR